MKKKYILLTLMFLLPLSVNAEVKEFKDKVYVTEENDIKDYYCEELKDKENVFSDYYTYNEFYLYDYSAGNTPDRYLLDMNNKSCKLISEEEFEKLTKKEDEIFYEVRDNKIYEISSGEEKEVADVNLDKFILKKEISGLEEDKTFGKFDLMQAYKIYDKFYVSVEVEIGAEPALALFDLEGNPLVIDGHSLFGRNGFILSGNNLLSFMVAISENKSYNYIIDKDFNIIHKKEFNRGSISYIPLLINTNEHIDYFTTEGLIDSIMDNIIEIRNYYLISGDKKYNNKDMNYELSANLKELKSVFINDKEISKEKYTTKDNKLTLNNKYLATLEKGIYKLKVLYNDGGYVNTNFTIDVIANPPTGDNIMKSIIFGSISLLGLILTILFIKRNKQFN